MFSLQFRNKYKKNSSFDWLYVEKFLIIILSRCKIPGGNGGKVDEFPGGIVGLDGIVGIVPFPNIMSFRS